MKITILTAVYFLFLAHTTFAQKFWLTTYEFPGRAKTGITITPNDCLFVSSTNGVLRSCNEGNSFDTVLRSNHIFSIFSNSAGKIFVGGSGKIYMSENHGQTWDSVALNTTYPITKIIANSRGHVFAITGILTADGFEGDGVFYSSNNGLSWTQRNNGLGIYTCIEQIAIDKNDRLYIATADEYVTGSGGLFISENNGLLWEHINIEIDGQGVVNNQIKVANVWGLSISRSDSVYFSFFGTAVNTSVRLNTVKHINQIRGNSPWNVYNVVNLSSWWQDKLLNNIYFARNGDKYSSVSGSVNFGGTFFCKNQQNNWQKINYGLGVDEGGMQNIQHFAEASNGKVFMVQTLDERVYFSDASLVTSIADNESSAKQVLVFPNPVVGGETVAIMNNSLSDKATIEIVDIMGNQRFYEVITDRNAKLQAPIQPGLYFIIMKNSAQRIVKKLIVF
jgi:photosystem II stability/assembly factor-like uncharacterized protein